MAVIGWAILAVGILAVTQWHENVLGKISDSQNEFYGFVLIFCFAGMIFCSFKEH